MISILLLHILYPYIIKQTGDEDTQTYQVEFVILIYIAPNSHNLFTRKCVAVRGEN